jgi:sugar/nucleoside kinase (ribokinase family)
MSGSEAGGPIDVLCAGILVADLFVPPLPRLPEPGELQKVGAMPLAPGGCAVNTALDLVRLGLRVGVAGLVGRDLFGEFIRRDLLGRGLADASGIREIAATPTSQTVILPVTGQDRRFIHSVGANAAFRVADVDRDAVARCRALYVGGYGILPAFDPEELGDLFAFARSKGVRTVLDVAGVSSGSGPAMLAAVLPHVDAFLPNNDEARLLTGEADPVRQARRFVDLGAATAVVTRGGDGLAVATRDGTWTAGAFAVDVVDASGSGDAFDAGFIVGLIEGWDLGRTLAFASAAGGSCCTRLGTTAGVFTRAEAEAFLASHPFTLKEETP